MSSEHRAVVRWQRHTPDFDLKTFDRNHTIEYEGGESVRASSAPDYNGDPSAVDPEQGLVGALASCHMLTFLAVAALRQFVVNAYEDDASAELGKNEAGRMMVKRMVLRPKVTFAAGAAPSEAQLAALHEKAHANCFIANSLSSEVAIEPR
ncbi:OsmC family protein [Plasticicumulans acidivorans]|uniref:Organic hydroperoxide reductase OsmC/OhrA n=1 Tax=Plasticicumulans acidivorans TaxID=886464 RepID=A0A317MXW6_9GAMM|nr:OsmC family protein [Plasticicumulans acidivorans]PWV64384.1 organic hydroperoxide reductase OsmC/OhrA [Plasticicumulans acidivorans]